MQYSTAGSFIVESQDTHVVYDRKTGAIVHVHHTVNLKGAANPFSLHSAAERARETAKTLGHDLAKLETMRVEEFDGRTPSRVDVKTKRLVAVEIRKPVARRTAKKAVAKSKKKKR